MFEDRIGGVMSAPAGKAAPRTKRTNWIGWGVAALIIVGCLFFIDIGLIVGVVRRRRRPPSCWSSSCSVRTGC